MQVKFQAKTVAVRLTCDEVDSIYQSLKDSVKQDERENIVEIPAGIKRKLINDFRNILEKIDWIF